MILYDDGSTFKELFQFLKEKNKSEMRNDSSTTNSIRYNGIEIDLKYRTFKRDGIYVELTNYEFDILYLLARHPKQVFSKKQIYEQVWNLPYLGAEDNVVSLIHRIRKKIEPDPARPIYILTVWGIGYKFNGALDG